MSTRGWKVRVEDILAAILRIQNYTQNMDYQTWCNDSKTIDAVVRNFEVIGEASTHIPLEIQTRYPDIPWQTVERNPQYPHP